MVGDKGLLPAAVDASTMAMAEVWNCILEFVGCVILNVDILLS